MGNNNTIDDSHTTNNITSINDNITVTERPNGDIIINIHIGNMSPIRTDDENN